MREFIKRWKWLSLFTGAVIILSVAPIPDNAPMEDVPLIDKWVHFVMYAGLVFAGWFDRMHNKSALNIWLFAVALCLFASLLGGLLELVQGCTSFRSCELLDFYADTIGAVLATVIAVLVHLLLLGVVRRPS